MCCYLTFLIGNIRFLENFTDDDELSSYNLFALLIGNIRFLGNFTDEDEEDKDFIYEICLYAGVVVIFGVVCDDIM